MSLQMLAALTNNIPFHPIPGAQLSPQQSVTPFPLEKAVASTLFSSEPRQNSSGFHKDLLPLLVFNEVKGKHRFLVDSQEHDLAF